MPPFLVAKSNIGKVMSSQGYLNYSAKSWRRRGIYRIEYGQSAGHNFGRGLVPILAPSINVIRLI